LKRFYLENLQSAGFNTDSLANESRLDLERGQTGRMETLEKILLHIKEEPGLKVHFHNFLV
jgi:hypothetical protein